MRPLFAICLIAVAALFACSRSKSAQPVAAAASPPADETTPVRYDTPSGPAQHVDGNRAMQYTREIVAFGPRPVGSEAHKKVEQYVRQHLKNGELEEDRFTAHTVAGDFPMTNFIAKFPGTKDGIVVFASHYETNYPLRNTSFVGANDGACTSALLLQVADHFRGRKLDGYSVWLVWDDGEEAMQQWSAEDSLYGTKHLAAKWAQDGTAKKIKALFVLDMIGDKDLDIQRDENSTPWLEDLVYAAAQQLGYQSHFFQNQTAVQDDHLPFKAIGVPVADIIDIDYGYNNVYHHTTQDTIDKLSPESLQIVGDVMLRSLQLLNER